MKKMKLRLFLDVEIETDADTPAEAFGALCPGVCLRSHGGPYVRLENEKLAGFVVGETEES